MDSFQGQYKNGTEPGTRDCRSFLAVFFVLRILGFMIYAFTPNAMTFAVGLVVMIVSAGLVVVKPHLSTHLNLTSAAYFHSWYFSINLSRFFLPSAGQEHFPFFPSFVLLADASYSCLCYVFGQEKAWYSPAGGILLEDESSQMRSCQVVVVWRS